MTKIEIYTKTSCSYCARAKRLLAMKSIAFEEYPVDFGGPKKDEMIQRAGGRSTVPQIFVAGQHIGGCDDLMALEQAGKLDALLTA